MTEQGSHPDLSRASVDVVAMEAMASQLLPAAADVRQLAGNVMRHAPDPGTPPAPDAVVAVQTSAVDALTAMATALEESSHLLVMTARRYQATEDEIARAMGRIGQDRP